MAYQPSTVAATVSCPVTIVIGLGDKMTTPASARALAQTLTNPKLIELAGTGHMMMLENPRAVRSILKETVS
jgi:pimeloyl-ACP methyl ester carboxylesterase